MAPPQEGSASFRQQSAAYATEPKRMRLSSSARSTAAAAGSSTTTRASTGAPTAMTNKGSVYKAQRGRAVTAAAVKAKAPTTTHRRRGRKGKSVYRGVCVTREGKWRAVIYKERKQLYLGVYESEVDAAKAHDRAARFHFAENAVCNFDSEHEADRQAVIHKQRQLLEQQQQAEDRAHAQLHGGSFSVGREEFDDLDEYHRGMDEACSSEEDEREADAEAEREGDGEDCGDGYDEVCSRSSRSMSSSCSSSTGSTSDDRGGVSGAHHHQAEASGSSAAAAAAASAFEPAYYSRAQAGTAAAAASAGAGRGGGGVGGVGNGNQPHSRERGCSDGESDSDYATAADVATASPLIPDAEQPSAQEGMGFPYAEDLLGYEMQSWYCCQDDDDRSPASSGGAPYESQQQQQQQQQQQPFMGRQQQSEELWGTSVGANLGWGFGDFAQAYSDGGSRASSGSMSSGSLSCDDDCLPSALPPLMGISGEP